MAASGYKSKFNNFNQDNLVTLHKLCFQEDYYPRTQIITVGAAASSYSSKVLYCPAAAGESGHLLFPEAPAYPRGLDHLTSHLVISLLHSAS